MTTISASRSAEFKRRFKLVAYTKKWAVTEVKVRIRQAVVATPWPRWHLLTFAGRDGGESRGVVDMIAVRKDHGDRAAGIGHVSSHAFRHTYRSWLDAVGTSVAVQQKLMRHPDIRTTLNVYGDVVTDEMQEAGSKVAGLALSRA